MTRTHVRQVAMVNEVIVLRELDFVALVSGVRRIEQANVCLASKLREDSEVHTSTIPSGSEGEGSSWKHPELLGQLTDVMASLYD